jgi:hypothetical protein
MNNIAVEMIGAALRHYQRQGKKVRTVYLSKLYWLLFKDYMSEKVPEVNIENGVVFNKVTVKKGSLFMKDNLSIELWKTGLTLKP